MATGGNSGWQIVAGPNTGFTANGPVSVIALTATDAWAVGNAGSMTRTFTDDAIDQQTVWEPLIEHWDGAQWSIVPGPPLTGQAILHGIAASSPDDVWAVGSLGNAATVEQTTAEQALIEHWDGARWQVVACPQTGARASRLADVLAFAATDVWAVGATTTDHPTPGTSRTFVVHWNGQMLSAVPSPSPGMLQSLEGMAAVAPDDIWVVGWVKMTSQSPEQTLIEHWDGKLWHVMQSPSPGLRENYLGKLAVISTNDIWAVGRFGDGQFSARPSGGRLIRNALIEHWDGRQWSVIPGAHPGALHHLSRVVRVPGEADLWAVGAYHQQVNPFEGRTLIEKFSR